MYTIQQALQDGVNDYNHWASLKGEEYNTAPHVAIAHGELRGIFYNKLRNPLKQAIPNIVGFHPHVLNKLEKIMTVDNVICVFDSRQKNMLTQIRFEKQSYSYRYQTLTTIELIRQLNEASKFITYECFHDKVQYEIRNIISGIENFKIV